MSSALAGPPPRRELSLARDRTVAIVIADASARDTARSILATGARWALTEVAVLSLEQLERERPDAVVLVAGPAAPAGLAELRRIRKASPSVPLVVVAGDDGLAMAAREALNAGAEAFVPADAVAVALAPALDAVLAGFVCAPRTARRLVAKPTFSHREKQILALLVAGRTNREIAAKLYLAESTVKSHLVSAFAKLGVRSRKDAVALLLDPAEGLAPTALPAPAPGA